ncbi:MAG: pantetheine-phosphate adenylyltransferase [Erysipelotrichaceae bacterium]|nr:pantetheine-phosphate adenylyltransferase [Erysipelotrichaceae bacterium]
MTVAAFCGTFDPITLGHVNIIERSSRLFEKVIVVVSKNSEKRNLFSSQQRVQWVRQACAHLDNVEVQSFEGLVADACETYHADVLIRGIRNMTDCEYEQNMAYMNQSIRPGLDTFCLFTDNDLRFCSSSNVRECLANDLDVSGLVPACVAEELKKEKQG